MNLAIVLCMRDPNANGFLVLFAVVALGIIAIFGLAIHQIHE